ncbi:MAG: hypothetical protein AYK22_04930 [Thermoplasmatales archaeon SG8-52-3]|nr:MAG: hypothetical protein AYK22_04930 [Thermoplasmatales archaeon SG8-52-3]
MPDIIGDEMIDSKENVSKMFSDIKGSFSADEQLALHIIHKFNICRDTLETMPAFEEHLKPLFSKERDK